MAKQEAEAKKQFQLSAWEETKQQLWSAALSMMEGELMVAPGRTAKDFADNWKRYRQKYELSEVSSETDPGDMMDALEDLWNTRIRRNLDATADEVKQGLMAGLQRDKQDYEQKRTEAKARQDALRKVGLDKSATDVELAAAQEAVRAEVGELEREAEARELALDEAIADWQARAARQMAKEKAEAEVEATRQS